MAVERPILNVVGERVALGPLCDEHIDAIVRWDNDYSTFRFFAAPGPQRPEVVRKSLTEGMFASPETVLFVIYEVATWRLIGTAGLINLEHINRTAELFIMLGESDARGKGYGTEAMRLLADYAFTVLNLHSLMLWTYEYNVAGQRCYAKVGFREVGRRREARWHAGRYWDEIAMDLLASEFESPVLRALLDAEGARKT